MYHVTFEFLRWKYPRPPWRWWYSTETYWGNNSATIYDILICILLDDKDAVWRDATCWQFQRLSLHLMPYNLQTMTVIITVAIGLVQDESSFVSLLSSWPHNLSLLTTTAATPSRLVQIYERFETDCVPVYGRTDEIFENYILRLYPCQCYVHLLVFSFTLIRHEQVL